MTSARPSRRCCSSPIRTFSRTPVSRRPTSRAPPRRRSRSSSPSRWVESPTMGRALAFGAGAALAVGSRLSALAFVGGALGRVLRAVRVGRAARDDRARARSAASERAAGRERVVVRGADLGDLPVRGRADAPGRSERSGAGLSLGRRHVPPARQLRSPELPSRNAGESRLVVLLPRRARREDADSAAAAVDRRCRGRMRGREDAARLAHSRPSRCGADDARSSAPPCAWTLACA